MAMVSVPGTLREIGPRVIRLHLTIGGSVYEVEPLEHGPLARRVFRLVRQTGSLIGESVTVAWLADGRLECDCGDFIFRKQALGEHCKHLIGMASFLVPPGHSAA